MPDPIRLGISTCPNDTFTFHALLNGQVDRRGLDFEIELLDIEQLNQKLSDGAFDVAKASFHAALELAESTVVLPSGSALGFGVGPLLLSAKPDAKPTDSRHDDPPAVTLCPGRRTTAAMLFELFYGDTTAVEHCVFSEIMPKLKRGEADFGVCIHEGRFTWQDEGLGLVEDLGTRWEQSTKHPLPLGGLIAQKSLGNEQIGRVQAVVRQSLEIALADPPSALPTMRHHAQEFDDNVLMKHVDLYVNDWTVDLQSLGRESLMCLSRMAKEKGLISDHVPDLQVFDS